MPGLESIHMLWILKDRNACRSKVFSGSMKESDLVLGEQGPVWQGLSPATHRAKGRARGIISCAVREALVPAVRARSLGPERSAK